MHPGTLTVEGTRLHIIVVVGTYDIWALELALPFPRFSVRVVHRDIPDYMASPNVHVRNATTGEVEYKCGLGATIDEAVEDAIRMFLREVAKQVQIKNLSEEDFFWDGYSSG
jgi:hypothetical protein